MDSAATPARQLVTAGFGLASILSVALRGKILPYRFQVVASYSFKMG